MADRKLNDCAKLKINSNTFCFIEKPAFNNDLCRYCASTTKQTFQNFNSNLINKFHEKLISTTF